VDTSVAFRKFLSLLVGIVGAAVYFFWDLAGDVSDLFCFFSFADDYFFSTVFCWLVYLGHSSKSSLRHSLGDGRPCASLAGKSFCCGNIFWDRQGSTLVGSSILFPNMSKSELMCFDDGNGNDLPVGVLAGYVGILGVIVWGRQSKFAAFTFWDLVFMMLQRRL